MEEADAKKETDFVILRLFEATFSSECAITFQIFSTSLSLKYAVIKRRRMHIDFGLSQAFRTDFFDR